MAVAVELAERNYGEVFTKPSVISLMLKLSGLKELASKGGFSILEPSCGSGEFLLAILDELGNMGYDFQDLAQNRELFTAYELQPHLAELARNRVTEKLVLLGVSPLEAQGLGDTWIIHGDFLLDNLTKKFDLVIGNPPYIRIEEIQKDLLHKYRSAFSTMTKRADLYIPFFEKCLSLLNPDGIHSFICTDRWTKNQYGESLRDFISKGFNLDYYVDFYGLDAFLSKVTTYPAVTQISRKEKAKTMYCDHNTTRAYLQGDLTLTKVLKNFVEKNNPTNAGAPFIFDCEHRINSLKHLEETMPTLEQVGCKVFIGAATGNNKVYLVDGTCDIEDSRLLPCLLSKDISSKGEVQYNGRYLVNPYDENGLVDLDDYPKLKNYLAPHKEALAKRHTAKKQPQNWYKTIDRIYTSRAKLPKIFIPDIKGKFTVAVDQGQYYCNNSLYFVTSTVWPVETLAKVLEVVGQFFIRAYSTRVAGGNYRFQAQHLRRIRVPQWESLTPSQKNALIEQEGVKLIEVISGIYQVPIDQLLETNEC